MRTLSFLSAIMLTFLSGSNNSLQGQTTFKICSVKVADALLKEKTYREVTEMVTLNGGSDYDTKTKSKLEDYADRDYRLVPSSAHPFVFAVQKAYAEHRPLSISPDMIWLMIVQGFAQHVDLNAEALKHLFVDFKGKKMLNVVVGPDFKKGSPRNNWEAIFPQFSNQIGMYTKTELMNQINQSFSTTTNIEKAAFQVTLMDAMSAYFDYSMTVTCGIPEITLEGTPADWEKLEKQAQELSTYNLGWWTEHLEPVLHEFTNAAKGKPNKTFWAKIYNQKATEIDLVCTTALENHISGWVLNFFPYILGKKNPNLGSTDKISEFEINDLPSGLSKATLLLDDRGAIYNMELISGFLGIKQDKASKALRPEITWAVVDKGLPPSADLMKSYEEFKKKASLQAKTN